MIVKIGTYPYEYEERKKEKALNTIKVKAEEFLVFCLVDSSVEKSALPFRRSNNKYFIPRKTLEEFLFKFLGDDVRLNKPTSVYRDALQKLNYGKDRELNSLYYDLISTSIIKQRNLVGGGKTHAKIDFEFMKKEHQGIFNQIELEDSIKAFKLIIAEFNSRGVGLKINVRDEGTVEDIITASRLKILSVLLL